MLMDERELRGSLLKKELEVSQARINFLDKENHELKQEVARLRAQLTTLRAHDIERKSMLWKKLQNSMDALEKLAPGEEVLKSAAKEEKAAKSPKPLSRPTPYRKEAYGNKLSSTQMTPATPPPPPPPPPSKLLGRSKALHRAPEVMEFYRSLMKREAKKESRTSPKRNLPALNPKNMIGEIENRSTYLFNIKSDVETHGELINFLSREVEAAAFTDISEVEKFVKWLDGELSCLVDERAVLKHFPQWPEKKADALREAACSHQDLSTLQSEVSSYKDNPKHQLAEALRKMQALQDRLERSVNNIERMREGTSKKYGELHIPWSWMLDAGAIGQQKFSSVTLAKQYMKRIARELERRDASQEDDLLLQGVRFASRVHQTMGAFEELRRIGLGCQKH